jgi:hypothetical protein
MWYVPSFVHEIWVMCLLLFLWLLLFHSRPASMEEPSGTNEGRDGSDLL